jgi:hypothetical protein
LSITDSEKIMRDSLHNMAVNGDILFYHRENTPQYFNEHIDFTVIDNKGKSYLIESKESGSSKSISPSQFKRLQKSVLKSPVINEDGGCTRGYIHARIFDGDSTKRAKRHYDYHLLVPGNWIGEKTISLDNLGLNPESDDVVIRLPHEDVHLLSVYKNRSWHGMSEEYGRTTNGNESLGFESIPVLEVE